MVSPDAPSLDSSSLNSGSTPLYARLGLTHRSNNSDLHSSVYDSSTFNTSDDDDDDNDDENQGGDERTRLHTMFQSPILSPGMRLSVHAQLQGVLGALNGMIRPKKKQRVLMTPTQKVQENHQVGKIRKTSNLLWIMCDDKAMKKHHIDLLNADIARMGHSRIGLLCNSEKFDDEESVKIEFGSRKSSDSKSSRSRSSTISSSSSDSSSSDSSSSDNSSDCRSDNSNNSSNNSSSNSTSSDDKKGYWVMYFPISELNNIWTGFVSQCYFWGDKYGSKISIDLIKSESELSQYITLQKMSRGTSWKDDIGFDTVSNLVDRGDIDMNCMCCRIQIYLPTDNCKENEVRRTGERFLQIMPENVRGPVMFCPPKIAGTMASTDGINGKMLNSRQMTMACSYRMCEEKIAIRTKNGRPIQPITTSRQPSVPQYIRDDDVDVDAHIKKECVLYKSNGEMAWIPIHVKE
jgi:hypothetical protein